MCTGGPLTSAAIEMKRQLSNFSFSLHLLLLNHLCQIWLRRQTHKNKYFASGTGNFAPTGGYCQHNFTWRVESSTLKVWTSTLIIKLYILNKLFCLKISFFKKRSLYWEKHLQGRTWFWENTIFYSPRANRKNLSRVKVKLLTDVFHLQ